MKYEDFLAESGFVEAFASTYEGRHDPIDALWWLSHPTEPGPSGADAPAAERQRLQSAAYSRRGDVNAERALAELERRLAADRAATLSAIERVRHPKSVPESAPQTVEGNVEQAQPWSRRRVVPLIVGAVALVVAIVLAVQLTAPHGSPTASTTTATTPAAPSSPASTASEAPQPTDTATFAEYGGSASCINVLDITTARRFTRLAYRNVSDALRHSQVQPDFPAYDFVSTGGLVCAWSEAGGTAVSPALVALYAYQPLDATSAQRQQAFLAGNGYEKSTSTLATIYTRDSDQYAFGDGFWAYSMTGDNDVLTDVVVHAPENADKPRSDLQSAVYVTSEGIGDLRIGSPVPSSSKVAAWNSTACGPDAGAYRPKGGLSSDADGSITAFQVVTDGRSRTGSLHTIMIFTPEIPTKSGIRVGDSEAKLQKTFPEFAHGGNYTLKGTIGKIRFQVEPIDPEETSARVVVAIYVVPIGSDFPATSSDAYGPCVA